MGLKNEVGKVFGFRSDKDFRRLEEANSRLMAVVNKQSEQIAIQAQEIKSLREENAALRREVAELREEVRELTALLRQFMNERRN